MGSFKELIARYDELKDMDDAGLIKEVGPWWADMFHRMKDDISKMKNDDKKDAIEDDMRGIQPEDGRNRSDIQRGAAE